MFFLSSCVLHLSVKYFAIYTEIRERERERELKLSSYAQTITAVGYELVCFGESVLDLRVD